jgi:hypothetical protein
MTLMGIKDFLMRKMLASQLKKANLPPEQQEMLLNAILENPKFFEGLAKEAQQIQKDQGVDQAAAMMIVMQKHQGELQKLFKR